MEKQNMATEENIMKAQHINTIDGAEELAQNTELSFEVAMNIVSIIERRESLSGDKLYFVEISDWMAEQWEKEHGISSQYLLVERVEDYSDKAWLVEGGLMVTHEGMADADTPLSNALATIDHGTTEYPRDRGTTWVAKSQAENIFDIQQ